MKLSLFICLVGLLGNSMAQTCTVEVSMDFAGADIGSTPANSADVCCTECDADPACEFWSWQNVDKVCYRKRGEITRKPDTKVTSGYRTGGAPPTAAPVPTPAAVPTAAPAPTAPGAPTPAGSPTVAPAPTPAGSPTVAPAPTPAGSPTVAPAPTPAGAPTVAPAPTNPPTVAPAPTNPPTPAPAGPMLSGMDFDAGILSPPFQPDHTMYHSSVDSSQETVTVTPGLPVNSTATIMVNGEMVEPGEASNPITLTAGVRRSVDILLTDEDNVTTLYSTKVSDLASLSDIKLGDDIVLDPPFDIDTTQYTTQVANSVDALSVMPMGSEGSPNATLSVNGVEAMAGQAVPITLANGMNTINFTVNALGRSEQTYFVDVNKGASPSPSDDDGLSGGAVAGIVIGSLFGACCLGAAAWFLCFKKPDRGEPLLGA